MPPKRPLIKPAKSKAPAAKRVPPYPPGKLSPGGMSPPAKSSMVKPDSSAQDKMQASDALKAAKVGKKTPGKKKPKSGK